VLADVSGDGYPDILSADDANDARQELWVNSAAWGQARLAPRLRGLSAPQPILRPGPGGELWFWKGGKPYGAEGRRRR
jgi:hypothetical protein